VLRTPVIRRVQQKEAHCGPATLEMLFSFYDLDISQDEVAKAAGMGDIITVSEGMRVDELALAVKALFPQGGYVLLAKFHSSLADVEQITVGYGLPVGVEWQGKFPQPDGSYFERGHYSIIAELDRAGRTLSLLDPEIRNLITPNGSVPIEEFEERWWEVDAVPLPDRPSLTRVVEMDRLAFVLARHEDVKLLAELGFRPVSLTYLWDNCLPLESME
jgi:hypothetical protein